jgi:N-methylhydantoinase A
MLVGVDIGGTFTDFVASVDGGLRVHKVLSTPGDPAEAMLTGLGETNPRGLAAVASIVHGSTVATNAILERKGARTALITTQGFRDILAIGRQNRPELYALQPKLPRPLIPRRWCYQVPERLDHVGQVLLPLGIDELDAVLDDIALEGIESIAVCLLYSYLNPVHEHAIRTRILDRGLLPKERIALSCEVLPEFREYERASTVALEAYVRPVVSGYLGRLGAALQVKEEGAPNARSLRIMKSDGGVISARRRAQRSGSRSDWCLLPGSAGRIRERHHFGHRWDLRRRGPVSWALDSSRRL